MAIHKPDPHWRPNIFQTRFRLPQKRYRSLCILPLQYLRVGFGHVASARRSAKPFLERARGFFAQRPPAPSAVSCADPLEAYIHACIAATLFCYVSPAIYGFGTMEEQDVSPRKHQSGNGS